MQAREIIRRKRDGETIPATALEGFVAGMADGSVGDEQLGAFAMAVFLQGMSDTECVALTESMRDSGHVMNWDAADLPGPVLDKHSTGGIGDVTSLLVAPIVAACGGFVPMIAGRGLGHTGGTIDKLEAIPGYGATLPPDRLAEIVGQIGCAIIGQTAELAPADRRLYAVRDVTATVESVPLIVASILSKKLAEGLDGLVLDVKTGNGAVMTDLDQARYLAQRLCEVGTGAGVRTRALLSDMSQPLADCAGNALEVGEVIAGLIEPRLEKPLTALSRELSAEMLLVGRLAEDRDDAFRRVDAALESGRAAERFAAMIEALGGPADLIEAPDRYLPRAPVTVAVEADGAGFVQAIDVRALGLAVVDLGGGRRKSDDRIDPAVGLSGLLRIGDEVRAGRPLARVHARNEDAAARAAAALRKAYTVGAGAPESPPLIAERRSAGEH